MQLGQAFSNEGHPPLLALSLQGWSVRPLPPLSACRRQPAPPPTWEKSRKPASSQGSMCVHQHRRPCRPCTAAPGRHPLHTGCV